jgi:hypothetical protein
MNESVRVATCTASYSFLPPTETCEKHMLVLTNTNLIGIGNILIPRPRLKLTLFIIAAKSHEKKNMRRTPEFYNRAKLNNLSDHRRSVRTVLVESNEWID